MNSTSEKESNVLGAVASDVNVKETTPLSAATIEVPIEESVTETDEPLIVTDEEKIKAELEGNSIKSLKRLNEKFMYNLMSVPTASHNEYRMVTFILLWAIKNGVDYHMDEYGNIYLTKGTLKEGEFYPCVTAHMDTVQDKQNAYAKIGKSLNVQTREGGKHGTATYGADHTGKHEIFVDGFGIGGDDKAGVLICLSMFSYVNKLKACFFLEEEVGCCGSRELDVEWFKNVGYVLGFDSPDLNRAAYCCSGTKLMNRQFFEDNGLAELCKSYGLNDFRSEPFTDVVQIRQKTEIICMNFGTGYYECHSATEYCVIEDMDHALDMGVAIIERLGTEEYKMANVGSTSYAGQGSYYGGTDTYFESLKPGYKVTTTHTSGSYSYPTNTNTSGTTNSNATPSYKSNIPDTDKANYEMVKYVSETYEEYINSIKLAVEAKCKDANIDFSIFSDVFEKKIVF